MKEDLLKYLKEEIIGEPDLDFTSSDDILASGLVDSMNIVKYIGWIAEKWNIQIPPQDMTIENFVTIEAIEKYLKTKLA